MCADSREMLRESWEKCKDFGSSERIGGDMKVTRFCYRQGDIITIIPAAFLEGENREQLFHPCWHSQDLFYTAKETHNIELLFS